jgi:hypothetical protein
VGLVVVALAGVPASAQTSSVIVAGQSAGGIRVGGQVDEAIRLLGDLYDRSDRDKYSIYDWPLRPFLLIAEKDSGKIVFVLVQLSDAYRTDKGSLTGGSERAAVEAAYGSEFTADEDQRSITLIYDSLGIAFDIGKFGVMRGRVMAIMVFVPGQWKQIVEGL